MKQIKTQDAIGMTLCHDITKIAPGEFKGRAFRRGHVIRQEHVEQLLKLGKDHIYVWEQDDNMIHEDDAALRLARAIGGTNVSFSEPNQGRINLLANLKGLLKINVNLLKEINLIDQMAVASLHNNRVVNQGEVVAGTRVIPLAIHQDKLIEIENICSRAQDKIIEIKPLKSLNVGMVTTGNEIYYGRVQDAFGPAVKNKLAQYDCTLEKQVLAPDDQQKITQEILGLIDLGVDMVVVTGGMSVDPDDHTPAGVRATGANLVTYGSPVLPGSMLMLAYLGDTPIFGLPGCVMYAKHTVFDLVLPRVLAGEKLTKEHIAELGHGGLCTECPSCVFPGCSFGKGR